MFRRLSLASVVVWFGVLVVLGMAITIVVELNRATSKSEQALNIATVTGAYGAAHDAHSQQEMALDGSDMRTHAVAATALRAALAGAVALDAGQRPPVDHLLTRLSAYEAAVDAGRLSEASALASEIEVGISNAGGAAGLRAHQLGISASIRPPIQAQSAGVQKRSSSWGKKLCESSNPGRWPSSTRWPWSAPFVGPVVPEV